MKRLIFLLSFGLFALMVIAGYSDSGVTKETLSYQVEDTVDSGSDTVFSMDFETSEFILVSPDLGVASPVNVRLSEKERIGYFTSSRAPPGVFMLKIRSYT